MEVCKNWWNTAKNGGILWKMVRFSKYGNSVKIDGILHTKLGEIVRKPLNSHDFDGQLTEASTGMVTDVPITWQSGKKDADKHRVQIRLPVTSAPDNVQPLHADNGNGCKTRTRTIITTKTTTGLSNQYYFPWIQTYVLPLNLFID